jgi:acyl-homoserine-lactone acylase
MRLLIVLLLLPLSGITQLFSKEEISRWEKQAANVTIIRDNWGIPHIYGKTDADAVFGLLYAQCEDDFARVEMNYIEKLGRLAEVKGEDKVYDDLLIRLVIDQQEAKADYTKAPAWLKKLCIAFADGINYYLYKHPKTKRALLRRFEPWFPLLWTDGSIGAINTAGLGAEDLQSLYTSNLPFLSKKDKLAEEEMRAGSNGFAFSPKITESGSAILYINPHVTFYFRPEVHMVSEEGLNAYGAVTWGQFFIYQGFNEHCGWMHTSSSVDAADSYLEKVAISNNKLTYLYDGKIKPITTKKITLKYKQGDSSIIKTFTGLFTHHGPILSKNESEWLSVKADNRILNGLVQCWQRTKAKGLADFKKTLDLKGNISNNTVYADAAGNIAYWHGNRIPLRNKKYDWSKPVDGSLKETEWQGYHPIHETVQSINPPNGWLQNCNSTPFTVAGNNSPVKTNYPAYMAPDGENFRGINAVRVLSETKNYTLDKVIKAGYDRRLAAFELMIPELVEGFESVLKPGDSLYNLFIEPITLLKNWDYRCDENSVATTLAIEWGQRLLPAISRIYVPGVENPDIVDKVKQFTKQDAVKENVGAFISVIENLQKKYGRWQIAWGEINRFQRISPDIDNKFDDTQPGYPVGFASAQWGMLPSYTSRIFPNTIKRYGVHGNSFICAVEFGKRVKAKSLLAGGQSSNPGSKHFFDQGELYSKGVFKEVLFYKEDVLQHAEKAYHPGKE